jgi:hypothetical protein
MMITEPPKSPEESLVQLREICPELSGALDRTAASGEVGLFTIFSDILLPLIANVLTGGADERFDRRHPGVLPEEATHRQDLVTRLYDVFEEWAISPDRDVRDVVYLELLEAGYRVPESNVADLNVDDLIRFAGPRVRAMRVAGPR